MTPVVGSVPRPVSVSKGNILHKGSGVLEAKPSDSSFEGIQISLSRGRLGDECFCLLLLH